MQTIDSGFCRTSSGTASQASAAQGFDFSGSHRSLQDRADQLVRATVLSDLGQSVGGRHGRHGVGIQGVAAAISKALSAQDVTGTDAADDVLKKIETSLHKAAQALADRGVDAKTIDATIDRFRSQLANALDGMAQRAQAGSSSSGANSGSEAGGSSGAGGTGTSAPANSVTSVSKFVAREVRKERGTIDLVTAEGDHVSIRFRTKEVVSGSVTQSTASDGTTTTAAKSSVFSRGGMKIEVDGDLNEDELAAIGDLLGKVDDIANKFFSGDVQAAFSAAGSVGVDSDQIAAYRLNLTYSRKVSAAYGYAGASLPVSSQVPASPSAGTTPADSASASPGAGTTPGDSASASGGASSAPVSSDASSGATGDAADGPTTTGAPATTDSPPASAPPASAQKTIIDFISDALSKLGSANGAGRLSFSMHWKMNVLVTAIQSTQPAQPTTATDQAAAANTQLLGDSLQKIAAA